MEKYQIWTPHTKTKLIEILAKKWPEDKARFKLMGKKQLYAIFYQLRGVNHG